ncbi:MAG: TIGR00300 family protein [Planctomycetota bacterium]
MAARFEKKIQAQGHLVDSDLLSEAMDRIIREGSAFRILDFTLGRTNEEPSSIEMMVEAPSETGLTSLLEQLNDLGFNPVEPAAAVYEPAPADGVAPEEFHSTTNHRTEVLREGKWIAVRDQRMDAAIVDRGEEGLCCVKLRDLCRGERVLVGLAGVRVVPEFTPRDRSDFAFMANDVSSERQVRLAVERIAGLIRRVRRQGKRIIWVPGPVVIHTGAGQDLAALTRAGFVDAVLTGNALAVHDVEYALFETSLGVSLKDGHVIHLGHRHHMRAINAIRGAGGLKQAVESGILARGIFHALIERDVPFVLAGSIRDDGPLPDTLMDLLEAQEAYARELQGAGLVIVLASMLHGIGVGNMLPGSVPLVCIDIHPAVVTKLADRGSAQTHGLVTDVGLFLHLLRGQLLDGGEGGGTP